MLSLGELIFWGIVIIGVAIAIGAMAAGYDAQQAVDKFNKERKSDK